MDASIDTRNVIMPSVSPVKIGALRIFPATLGGELRPLTEPKLIFTRLTTRQGNTLHQIRKVYSLKRDRSYKSTKRYFHVYLPRRPEGLGIKMMVVKDEDLQSVIIAGQLDKEIIIGK